MQEAQLLQSSSGGQGHRSTAGQGHNSAAMKSNPMMTRTEKIQHTPSSFTEINNTCFNHFKTRTVLILVTG